VPPRAPKDRDHSARPSRSRSDQPPTHGVLLATLRRLLAPRREGRPAPLLRLDAVAAATMTRVPFVKAVLESPAFRSKVAAEGPDVLPLLDAWREAQATMRDREVQRRARVAATGSAQSIQALRAAKAVGLGEEYYPEDFYGEPDLPSGPTSATPGSEEKIRVLTVRAAMRCRLHHPLDAGRSCPLVPDVPPGPDLVPAETPTERRQRLLYGPW
jgi:hypothetical protein